MESLILYIILFITILIGSYLIFKINNIQKNIKNENNSDDINSLKESINTQINSVSSSLNTQMASMSSSFNNLSKDVTKDMTQALTSVNEKVAAFNIQVEDLNKSQMGINKILAGVKKFGTLAEFSLGSLLQDLLPASQYNSNVKTKDDSGENVEFAIKLQGGVMVPVDSHFPVEKFNAIQDAFKNEDKKAAAEARRNLARAFRDKGKSINDKYINPPKTTDFAIVYAPTEGLYAELSSYRDPKTKELLLNELRTKYKVTIAGPNTLSALLQSYHLGFQTLRVQQHATQIYGDLRNISNRFEKHFEGIKDLRKKLEQTITTVDGFGRDARSIMNTLGNIKDPEVVNKSINQTPEKIKILK